MKAVYQSDSLVPLHNVYRDLRNTQQSASATVHSHGGGNMENKWEMGGKAVQKTAQTESARIQCEVFFLQTAGV